MPISYESNEIHLNLDAVPGIYHPRKTGEVVRPGMVVKVNSSDQYVKAAYADIDKEPLYIVTRPRLGAATNADIAASTTVDAILIENGLQVSAKTTATGDVNNQTEITISTTSGVFGLATTSNGSNRVLARVIDGVTGAENGDRIGIEFVKEYYTKS